MSGQPEGREAQLEAIDVFLDGVARWPAALVIVGEAGIGKSTVWSAGLTAARSRGHLVLPAAPVEAEAVLPFCAVGDVLDAIDEGVRSEVPPPQRRALEMALLLTDGDERYETGERHHGVGMLTVLRLLSQVRPVVIAIDDVEWLDGPSARTISFALRRLRSEPVGVIVTQAKGSDVHDPLELQRALPQGSVQHVPLGPLAGDALRLVVRTRLGPNVPNATLFEIERLSSGNPTIALEIAGTAPLADAGKPLPVPSRLRDVVRDGVEDLPEDVVDVLLIAAALTSPRVSLVEEVYGAATTSQLAAAESAGMIELEGDRVEFTHPVAASVLYLDAPPNERRRLHRRIAEVVSDSEERSFHLALATEGPDAVVAAALDAAAVSARARGARARAAELLELARSLTPVELEDEAIRRTLDAADEHSRAGNMVRARGLLEEALDDLPRGVARAEALARLGRIRSETDSLDAAIELGEQALEAGGAVAQRAAVGSDLAMAALLQLDVERARAHAAEALDRAEEVGADAIVAETMATLALCDALVGRDVWAPLIDVAIKAERKATGVRPARSATFARSQLLSWQGDLAGARRALQTLQAKTLDAAHEDSRVFVLTRLCQLEVRAGEWARAAKLAEDAEAASLLIGQDPQRAVALSGRALLATLHGDVATARALAEEGRELAVRTGCRLAELEIGATLGLLELSVGDAAAAEAELRPVVDAMAAAGITEPGALACVPDAVEAALGTGQVDLAAELLDPFEERARALGRRWAVGVSSRCRGLLLAVGGDVEGAIRTLDEGLHDLEGVSMPFEVARTLLAKGRAQRRAKQWGPARQTLERALSMFESLGAALWVEATREDLLRIGGRAASSDSELTAGERQAAELVAQGLTNREVADALFISLKTVEATLTRVYRKLDVRSRTELRSRFADRLRPSNGDDHPEG